MAIWMAKRAGKDANGKGPPRFPFFYADDLMTEYRFSQPKF